MVNLCFDKHFRVLAFGEKKPKQTTRNLPSKQKKNKTQAKSKHLCRKGCRWQRFWPQVPRTFWTKPIVSTQTFSQQSLSRLCWLLGEKNVILSFKYIGISCMKHWLGSTWLTADLAIVSLKHRQNVFRAISGRQGHTTARTSSCFSVKGKESASNTSQEMQLR